MPQLRQRSNGKDDYDNRIEEIEDETEEEEEEEVVNGQKPYARALIEAEDSSFSWVDIARSIVFVLLLSGATSYFITRDSFTFNLSRPSWTRPAVIQNWINGPKQYTDEDLKSYDGTDPDKPILLAVNGTIYDVSNGRKHYGPGGTYHFFAGADASRAFVTSCFEQDISPDMRGVETMFLPTDDPSIDSLYTSGQLKSLKEQERRRANEKTYKALKHWVDFFENSKKYTKVGSVKREIGWETKGEAPTLCEAAERKRPKRKAPDEV